MFAEVCADDGLVRRHFGRGSLCNGPPCIHNQDPIRQSKEHGQHMLDHYDGDPHLPNAEDQLMKPRQLRTVKSGGRFVEHEQSRPGRQRGGKHQPLARV